MLKKKILSIEIINMTTSLYMESGITLLHFFGNFLAISITSRKNLSNSLTKLGSRLLSSHTPPCVCSVICYYGSALDLVIGDI